MIYLDYAATAPLRPEVSERLLQLSQKSLGNPSSLHRSGRQARMYLEQAREKCADLLGAKVEEILFCSGATEADNLALLGPLTHGDSPCQTLVSSSLEHAAVFETVRRQEMSGRKVSWLEVTRDGTIDLESAAQVLSDNPKSLVSVMACNNEIGTFQPVDELAALCRDNDCLLHVDAVQSPKTAQKLIKGGLVDLLCLSGHKLGGLHGGLLYVRQGVPINPQIVGGAQEDGRRAGTSEVMRADSFALALELALNDQGEAQNEHYQQLLAESLAELEGAVSLSQGSNSHISSWVFGELPAEPILVSLDLKGICASSGSACSSHSVEPSRVVKSMGYNQKQASGLIRLSWGWNSRTEEIQRAAELLREIILHMQQKEKSRR